MAETSDPSLLDDVCPSMPLETMLKLLEQQDTQSSMDETQRAVMEVMDRDHTAVMELLNRDPTEAPVQAAVNGDPGSSMMEAFDSDSQVAVMEVLNGPPYVRADSTVEEVKTEVFPVEEPVKPVNNMSMVAMDTDRTDSVNISGSQLPLDWDTFEVLEEIIKKDELLSSTTVKREQPERRELASCRFPEVKDKKPAVIEIIEQPKARSLRFRYECEGRSAGSILGENSTPETRTYPVIRLLNCSGPAMILVSLVTKDDPPKPHPHSLVGKGCFQGICKINVPEGQAPISFPNLGIQCVKRKEITQALTQRLKLGIDPFHTYRRHKGKMDEVDLNTVRLCFQAFIPHPQTGQCTVPVPPRVSTPIHDKKAPGAAELRICKMNKVSGPVTGGDEVTLLCDKVQKDDVEVIFSATPRGIRWESKGDFSPTEVHRQVAIIFKAPPYFDLTIREPIKVQVRLKRPSDGEESEPFDWTYTPVDKDEHSIESKRRKKVPNFARFLNLPSNSGSAAGVSHPVPNMRSVTMASLQTRPTLATGGATVSEDVRQLLRRKVQGQGQGGAQQLIMPPMQTRQLKQDQDLPSCAFASSSQLPTQTIVQPPISGASAMRAAPPPYQLPVTSQQAYPQQYSAVSFSGLMQATRSNIPLASRVDPTGTVYDPSAFISRGGRKSAKTAPSGSAKKQKTPATTTVSSSDSKHSFTTTDLSSLGLTFTQVEVQKPDTQGAPAGAQPEVYLEPYQGGDELLNSIDISSLELGSEVTIGIDANTHADLNELLEMVKQNKDG